MILINGKIEPTYKGQTDMHLNSIEWFTPNNEWRRILDTVYPIKDAEILDDTLDCGCFQFINELCAYPDDKDKTIQENNKVHNIKQLTPIRILWDFDDENRPIWKYRVVDNVSFQQYGRLFEFTVKTIEPTKMLELEDCDTLTFTNKLGRDSSNIKSHQIDYELVVTPSLAPNFLVEYVPTDRRFVSPMVKGMIRALPIVKASTKSGTNKTYYPIAIKIITPSNSNPTLIYSYEYKEVKDASIHYTFSEKGRYEIRYYMVYSLNGGNGIITYYDFDFYIKYLVDIKDGVVVPQKPSLTISDCLNRIVCFGKTRRNGIEKQKYKFDPDIIAKYDKTPAPEFYLARPTLFEALKIIAGHVHAIPRLVFNEESGLYDKITLEELGGNSKCDLKAAYKNTPIALDIEKKLDSYCGEINTYVDNLVNTKDRIMGTIVEPFEGGWISARAGDGVLEVTDDTVKFTISRPGYRITKLEIRYPQDVGYVEADITPYLYEEAEYETLHDFNTGYDYPYTTAYAIKYKQGGNEISELAHCSKDKNLTEIYKTEAIRNIIRQTAIGSIQSGTFIKIQYRVTYSPIISSRIVQKKQYINDNTGFSRIYNVSANTVESEYLGEHLKGAIARIGNDVETRTYVFNRPRDVPNTGQLLDGQYISQVICEIATPLNIKATVVLSKDFNQKNEYVAIDSNFRLYDVSEKQSSDRHINYGENVVIGNEITTLDGTKQMATVKSVEIFRDCFNGNKGDLQISWASFQGKSKKYPNITIDEPKSILLPCISQAEGNSLMFNFACRDNYGAGYQINNERNSYSAYRTSQTMVPYGNMYGEFETMDLCFGNYWGIGDINKDDLPKTLPEWTQASLPNGLFSTGYCPLLISKDSRECINFTYQLHFVVNRRDIIVGPALGQNNPLVTNNKGKQATCYLLAEPLNKFADYVNLTKGATKITSGYLPSTATLTEKKFCLPAITNTTTFTAKAIAWVDESGGGGDGKLIIGENIEILPSGRSKEIWFNFTANC